MEVIPAVLGLVIGVGVVLASVIAVLESAFALVRPAVILGVRETGDGFAIKGVKGIDPGLIVEVRGIGIVRRLVPDLTTVVDGFKRRAKALEEFGARRHQVDRACVIAERPGHSVWNVVRVTRLLGRFEDGRAGIVENAFHAGRGKRLLLVIFREIALCPRKGHKS